MEQTEAVYHLMVACDTVGSGGLNTIGTIDVFEGFSMNMLKNYSQQSIPFIS